MLKISANFGLNGCFCTDEVIIRTVIWDSFVIFVPKHNYLVSTH